MKTYEVHEHNSAKPWRSQAADSPADAIKQLIARGRWYAEDNVVELIDVREVEATPVLLALLPDGRVMEVIG